MSLFGPREDDPLLQNDPFSPCSEERDTLTRDQHSSGEETGSERDSLNEYSVFDESTEHRILYSKEEAARGHLDELHSFLRQGWTIDQIEIPNATSLSRAFSIVFVLRPSTDA